MSSETPQLKKALVCRFCKKPCILRYHTNVIRFSESPMKMRCRWVWERDCDRDCRRAHKRAEVEIKPVKIDAMPGPKGGQSGSHRIVSALRAIEAWLREGGLP